MYQGFFIAGMNLPSGPITYHLEERWLWYLGHVTKLEKAPKWDGHLPQDVVIRLLDWRPYPFMLQAHGDQGDLSGKSADQVRSSSS